MKCPSYHNNMSHVAAAQECDAANTGQSFTHEANGFQYCYLSSFASRPVETTTSPQSLKPTFVYNSHGRRNRGGGQLPPPPIFCQPKNFKVIKTTTYTSVYRNMAKIC